MTAADKRRPYKLADAFRSKHVLDAVISPNGENAVCVVLDHRHDAGSGDLYQATALWQVDLATGSSEQLTHGRHARSPHFMPDGQSVLYLDAIDDSDPTPQIIRLSLTGEPSVPITKLVQGVASFALAPDGETVAFVAFQPPTDTGNAVDHVRIDRDFFRFDSIPGYLQDAGQAIFIMPVAGDPHRVSEFDGLIMDMAWSPDSRELLYAVTGRRQDTAEPLVSSLIAVTSDGISEVVVDGVFLRSIFWVDSELLGFVGTFGLDWAENFRLYTVDRASGEAVSRTDHLDRPVQGIFQIHSPSLLAQSRVVPTADGDSALVAVSRSGSLNIDDVALTGADRAETVIGGARVLNLFAERDGQILFASQDINSAPELQLYDRATGVERRITDFNTAWSSEIDWPAVDHMAVTTAEGVEVDAWIMKPAGGTAPYKTVLATHGGPHASYGNCFNEDYHNLVGSGFAVVMVNNRGTSGYGHEFATAIIGNWGFPEAEDFNAVLDYLVDSGVCDKDRLGVTGISGGGHLTGWMIGQTDRFVAAVAEHGIYNMVSMYGVSDLGVSLVANTIGGEPHELPELYWKLSPIAYAHQVQTPTLLIQGENDIRCPMEQAEQMYTLLRHNGCTAEFLRLSNCDHGSSLYGPPDLRTTRMTAIADWFLTYLP